MVLFVNLCFETSERSVHKADNNCRVNPQALQLNLTLQNFKLVSYFNSVIVSNQLLSLTK